ncbi:MAG: hypothetical protein KAG98_01895 [Lentisphaeria bacterium]|nr:hypothetical protein [Lentisphaeria bacterium]
MMKYLALAFMLTCSIYANGIEKEIKASQKVYLKQLRGKKVHTIGRYEKLTFFSGEEVEAKQIMFLETIILGKRSLTKDDYKILVNGKSLSFIEKYMVSTSLFSTCDDLDYLFDSFSEGGMHEQLALLKWGRKSAIDQTKLKTFYIKTFQALLVDNQSTYLNQYRSNLMAVELIENEEMFNYFMRLNLEMYLTVPYLSDNLTQLARGIGIYIGRNKFNEKNKLIPRALSLFSKCFQYSLTKTRFYVDTVISNEGRNFPTDYIDKNITTKRMMLPKLYKIILENQLRCLNEEKVSSLRSEQVTRRKKEAIAMKKLMKKLMKKKKSGLSGRSLE